jgi:hypothetical protein
MRMKRLLAVFTLSLSFISAYASEGQSELINELHKASESINQHVNSEAIVESLYKQIRPRVNITKTKPSEKEIDDIVRGYIAKKYAPALINNYSLIYSKQKESKKDFSKCDRLNGFSMSENVLMALCIKRQSDSLQVNYMTNGYGNGWATSLIFVFAIKENLLTLNSIDLQMKEGQKAYVEGL